MRHLIFNTLALVTALCLSSTSFAIRFNQKDFEKLIADIKNGTADLSLPELNRYHVVFVGGYMNEIASKYFRGPEDTVRKYGDANVTILMPSSKKSVADNIPLLKKSLLEAYKEGGGKPLLLIGHSKGGVESLATVLAHPELISRNIIASVTTVQSPLAGCYIAACFSDFLKWSKRFSSLDGGHSLHPEELNRMIREGIRKLPKDIRADISDRVHYVISKQQTRKVAHALKYLNWAIEFDTGAENDGLVEKTNMWIRKFGKVIASLDADHMELVVNFTLKSFIMGINTPRSAKNRAFTYLLMKSLLAEISTLVNKPKSCQTLLY